MVTALVGGCLLTLAGPVFDSSKILMFYYPLSGIRGGRDLFHKNVSFKKWSVTAHKEKKEQMNKHLVV